MTALLLLGCGLALFLIGIAYQVGYHNGRGDVYREWRLEVEAGTTAARAIQEGRPNGPK